MVSRTVENASYEGSEAVVESDEALLSVFVGLESEVRQNLLLRGGRSEIPTPRRRIRARGVSEDVPSQPPDAKGLPDDSPPHLRDADRLLSERQTIAAAEDGTVWITTIEQRTRS